MRWIRYSYQGSTGYGVLEGDVIRPVEGDPFAGHSRTSRKVALADVTVQFPVVPPTFYAAGKNYKAHLTAHGDAGVALKPPAKPDIGYRANNSLIAHNQPIVIPRDATEKVQYEGELVAVIGKKAKNLSFDEALSCVLGYTIGNDLTERSWIVDDLTLWRSKNTDTFSPMGPWIETDVNLDELVTTVRVNGRQTIQFRTNDMIFGVAEHIVAMTRYLTLYPGDVVWMGTEGISPNLKSGDVVDIEISGIGTLSNKLVKEGA